MFNRQHYENSEPDGVAVLEVVRQDGEPAGVVPLRRTMLTGEITGPLADLRMVHHFGYTRKESDRTLEARYRFPLPGDAAVIGVTVRFGDVEIVAEIKPRQAAEDDYAHAKKEGRQAALATREGADVFTLQVAGLQPDQEVMIETHYVQLARPHANGWQVRIPLTVAPRFVRADELGARHAQGQPLALLRDPGHRFSVDLNISGAEQITSQTHELSLAPSETGTAIRLAAGALAPDRDFVINWRPASDAQRPLLTVFTYADQQASWDYFVAQLAPPTLRPATPGPPREVILLVDHSGSMTGPKWAATDWAVERFLTNLQPYDSFALGFFHSTTHWLQHKLQVATPEQVKQANAWLKRQRESGGTELGVALEQALQIERAPGQRARHLLILTDAEVTDAARILRLAESEAGQEDRRRISVLCIDAAPNAHLAQELADRGGGLARFLTSDPDQQDITTALDEVLADWAEPVLAGLSLVANRAQVQASGRRTTQTAANESIVDLGDLAAGRAIWVVGRAARPLAQNGPGALALSVQSGQGHLLDEVVVAPAYAATPAIKALFGARRINTLEYLIAAGYDEAQLRQQLTWLGYDPDEVLGPADSEQPRVYAENQRAATANRLRALLGEEARSFHLASSETAFIATRREAGKVIERTVEVANALPAGWSSEFLSGGGQGAIGGMVRRLGASSMPMPAMSVAPPSLATPMAGVSKLVDRALKSSAKLISKSTQNTDEQTETLFHGALEWRGHETVLFDSTTMPDPFPAAVIITALRVEADGLMRHSIGPARLLIYVDDLATPRAEINLHDLLQLGERPLNLRRRRGQKLMILLRDATGLLAQHPVTVMVQVRWRPAIDPL
jgi:Ca-activated chloride channel family protein